MEEKNRYFNLKNGNPKQYGAVLKVNSKGVEDICEFLNFQKFGKDRFGTIYRANLNTDIYGNEHKGRKKIVGIRVGKTGNTVLVKNPRKKVTLVEITQEQADKIQGKVQEYRYTLDYIAEGMPSSMKSSSFICGPDGIPIG